MTVCPVVGVSVGVQTAPAGSAAQPNAATASVHTETVVRNDVRKDADALEMGQGANRFGENADRIIDISRSGARQPLRLAARSDASGSTYHQNRDARPPGASGNRIIFDRYPKSTEFR